MSDQDAISRSAAIAALAALSHGKKLVRSKQSVTDRVIGILRALPAIDTCRHCGASMQPGIAMGQTFTGGAPDLGGDIATMSAGGPGEVIGCMKCPGCGWSVTGEAQG